MATNQDSIPLLYRLKNIEIPLIPLTEMSQIYGNCFNGVVLFTHLFMGWL